MTAAFTYLHPVGDNTFWLDHRLTPEVRAMLCAMASRAPLGGVRARYAQIVETVAESLWLDVNPRHPWADMVKLSAEPGNPSDILFRDDDDPFLHTRRHTLQQSIQDFRLKAEDRLCNYPLHPKVQKFFDDFVARYGHSSIMELTGSPAVYSEGISWLTAWLLFDSPLCAGQEFSTRAVQHKDWPMARESHLYGQCVPAVAVIGPDGQLEENPTFETRQENPDLAALHRDWFEVFEAEVAWWKEEFTSSCPDCYGVKGQWYTDTELRASYKVIGTETRTTGMFVKGHGPWTPGDAFVRDAMVYTPVEHVHVSEACPTCQGTGKKYPTADKEPFRPALDRARWALPGTIATGCAHTTSLRERSRVMADGMLMAVKSGNGAAQKQWRELMGAYREALPGLAGMGLKETIYNPDPNTRALPGHLASIFSTAPEGPMASVDIQGVEGMGDIAPFIRKGSKSYMDPLANHSIQVSVAFRCSLAVARDWHRHRTLYPWHLQIVRTPYEGRVDDMEFMHPGLIQIDHHYEAQSELAKKNLTALLMRSTQLFDMFMARGDVNSAAMCLPLGTLVLLRGQGGLRDVTYMLELRKFAHGANFEYQDQATVALDQLQELVRLYSEPLYGTRPEYPNFG